VTDRDGRGLRIEEKKMKQESGKNGQEARVDIYAKITDRIIASLEEGVRPWVQPWSAGHLEGRITRPLRHNGDPYSGINVLLLWNESVSRGFQASTWMTFRQATELGAHVRKGETGSTVVYANSVRKTETTETGDEVERDIPFLKAYIVFNTEQIDDLPDNYRPKPEQPKSSTARIATADAFFSSTGADIRHGGNKAFYAPGSDHIQMPPIETFRDTGGYYATLAHESIHWTGSKDRIDRDLSRYSKDRSERAREELIAELGSVFLSADLGIVPELEPRPDHASYLASWLEVLDGDKRFIFSAAAHAQRAVAYLHDLQPEVQQGAA
jgi:antirestriction protein ArdC